MFSLSQPSEDAAVQQGGSLEIAVLLFIHGCIKTNIAPNPGGAITWEFDPLAKAPAGEGVKPPLFYVAFVRRLRSLVLRSRKFGQRAQGGRHRRGCVFPPL